MDDHCSQARTTTATEDWLPRAAHVWFQLHRQMVPRPLPLEAAGGGMETVPRLLLAALPLPTWDASEAPGPKPSPGISNPHGSQRPGCPAHSPTTSSFTNANPSTLRPDAWEPAEKTNSTSHTLRKDGRRCGGRPAPGMPSCVSALAWERLEDAAPNCILGRGEVQRHFEEGQLLVP